MKRIIETAIANDSPKILITAVKAADLAETLSKPGPFMVFAPNDEAFAKSQSRRKPDRLKTVSNPREY
jgi:uncharacterized surface protein with fasciclin (FAS1) repeats